MKTSSFLLLAASFTLASSFQYTHPQDSLTSAGQTSQDTVIQTSYKLCKEQCTQLTGYILELLPELSDHLAYWEQTQIKPWNYFFSKGPVKWIIGKKQQVEIEENIAALQTEINRSAYYLGLLQEYNQKFTKLPQDDDTLCGELYAFGYTMRKCLQLEYHPPKGLCDAMYILCMLEHNNTLLATYKERALTAMAPYKKPAHLVRQWIPYTLSALAVLYVGKFALDNQNKWPRWLSQSKRSVKHFYHTHIHEPVVNTKNIILTRQQPAFSSQEIIEKGEESLESQIRTFVAREKLPLTPAQVDEMVQAAKTGKIPYILKLWNEQTQSLLYNTWQGTWPRLLDIIIQSKVVTLDKVLFEMQNLIKANQINIELSAVLPTILLAYAGYQCAKKVHNQEWLYKKIKRTLLLVEKKLNAYNAHEVMTYEDKGMVIFWINQLHNDAQSLEYEVAQEFIKDSDELASSSSIQQKQNTIARMYRTYGFLNMMAW